MFKAPASWIAQRLCVDIPTTARSLSRRGDLADDTHVITHVVSCSARQDHRSQRVNRAGGKKRAPAGAFGKCKADDNPTGGSRATTPLVYAAGIRNSRR